MRKNFTFVLGGDLVAKIFTAGFVILAIRHLTVGTYATYAYLSSLVILAYTLVSGVFNRQFLLAPAELSNERRFRLLQIVASLGVLVLLIGIFRPAASALVIFAALVWAGAAAAYDFHRTAAQKRQRFGTYALIEVVRTLAMLLIGLLTLLAPERLQIAILFGAQAASYVLVAQVLRLQPVADDAAVPYRGILAQFVRWQGVWLLLYWSLVAIVGQAPLLLVAQLGGKAEIAALGSAMRYYGIALSVVVAVNVVILPHLSQATTAEETFRRFDESIRLLLIAMGAVILGAGAGYVLVPFVDGGKYPQAPVLFVLLCLGLLPGILMAPISSALLRLDRTEAMVLAMAAGLAITVAVSLLFPTLYGIAAAGPIGIVAQFVLGLSILYRVRKDSSSTRRSVDA